MGGVGIPEIFVVLAPFAFVGFIIWLALQKRQEKTTQHAEVQKEIIGKFSSAAEMQEFLKTAEGKALFKNLSTNGRSSRSPRERAIARIGLGIVLIIVGSGLVFLAHQSDQPQVMTAFQAPPPGTAIPNVPSPNLPAGPFLEIPPGMGLPAAAILLTGIGLVISALVTLKLSSSENPNS